MVWSDQEPVQIGPDPDFCISGQLCISGLILYRSLFFYISIYYRLMRSHHVDFSVQDTILHWFKIQNAENAVKIILKDSLLKVYFI